MGLPVEINPLLISSSGYVVGRSLRFRSSASAYLNRTPASASNRTTWTWSGWVKRGTLGASQYGIFSAGTNSSNHTSFYFTSDAIGYQSYSGGVAQWNVATNAVYRDPSAWYHLVVVTDTSNATSSNRILIYINGVSQSFSTASYPTSGTQGFVNQNNEHDLARLVYASGYSDLYLAEVNFIDGQALTPSSFGAYDTNGVWQPLKYGGTYGTNGFYLPFSDTTSTTTLVQDSSGNGNNWTPNNISLTAGTTYDSMIDSPTVGAGASNYCVLSPIDKGQGTSVADGNLAGTTGVGAAYFGLLRGTIGVTSGKWYWEAQITANGGSAGQAPMIGITDITTTITSSAPINTSTGAFDSKTFGYYGYNGNKKSSAGSASYGASFTTGNVIGVALDMDGGTLTFYKDGISQGTAFSSGIAGNTMTPALLDAGTGGTNAINFGQRPFSYTPPTGYSALNTYNLPTPTIANGAQYMAATTYTGNGSTQSISNAVNGVSFQPDFVWYKDRSVARDHALFNVTSGATYLMSSNNTSAESAVAGTLTSFNSNGYSIGSAANANANGETYVGWQWKGGGTGVTNTSGSITSTVSVNTTAGFSVVTYTGTAANATVGHGLGVAPDFIITKNRDAATDWWTYHSALGNTKYVVLNTTAASATSSGAWNNTSPTSTVFSLGSTNPSNANQDIAYCFAAVKGYSAFGSYTGNGSSDGPFIYTGFRPRFVMIKGSSFVSNWNLNDSSRSSYNLADLTLRPNLSNAEFTSSGSGFALDFLSNGFKLRANYIDSNSSGDTFIYAAFAENPFNYSRAR